MTTKSLKPGVLARAWFSVTPQERKVLFGLVVVTLIGLTARYLHLRQSTPAERTVPAGESVGAVEEMGHE